MAVENPDPDFDLAAAGLRADGRDVQTSVEVVAGKLEAALGDRCRVERKRVRLFGGDRRVETVEVALGEGTYALANDGRTVTATRGVTVRGVTIRRDELGLDEWVQRLTAELAAEAEGSAAARQALDRLLGA